MATAFKQVTSGRRALCGRRTCVLASRIAFALALVGASIAAVSSQAREFTDASGKFRVEAEYVGMQDGLVLLKKTNGVTIGVPPQRLSAADQEFIRNAGNAPMPAGDAAGGVDLGSITAADEYVRVVTDAAYSGDMQTVWDALPASYQQDVNDIVHLFGERMDRDLWNRGFGLASKVVGILRDKKQFIVNQPQLQQSLQASNTDPAEFSKNWDAMVAILSTLVNSEISDVEKLKTLEVGQFMESTGQKFVNQIKLASNNGEPAALGPEIKVTLIDQQGDTATLEIETPKSPIANFGIGGPGLAGGAGDAFGGEDAPAEGPQRLEFVRVEGRWIEKEMADNWSQQVAEIKSGLNEMTPAKFEEIKPMASGIMLVANGLVVKFQNANTQAEFDAAIMEVMGMVGGMMGGGAGGPPGADPFGPGAGPGADPFGN
ncbi:MAG: hypothetical protein KDA71_05450 [Planctomycetales bacterium]|nr:hypothetical protein [Planctomycetales bacterium]